MRLTTISDSHGRHQDIVLPKSDVLIHAGDVSSRGKENEVVDFMKWFADLDFKYKIFIAGNHDFYFERQTETIIQQLIPSNVIYLNVIGNH